MFTRTSRYADVAEGVLTNEAGREIRFKRLRVSPSPEGFRVHVVAGNDRLDRIAFTYFQDPEQFWRLCDINRVQRPVDLTADAGTTLAVPGPDGGGG